MNTDIIIGAAIAVSIIGTIAFAVGIAWALGAFVRRQRRPDPYDQPIGEGH